MNNINDTYFYQNHPTEHHNDKVCQLNCNIGSCCSTNFRTYINQYEIGYRYCRRNPEKQPFSEK